MLRRRVGGGSPSQALRGRDEAAYCSRRDLSARPGVPTSRSLHFADPLISLCEWVPLRLRNTVTPRLRVGSVCDRPASSLHPPDTLVTEWPRWAEGRDAAPGGRGSVVAGASARGIHAEGRRGFSCPCFLASVLGFPSWKTSWPLALWGHTLCVSQEPPVLLAGFSCFSLRQWSLA